VKSTFSTCDQDPYILIDDQRAIIFPKASMERSLQDNFYSVNHPDAVDSTNWIPGLRCLDTFKKAIAAPAGRDNGEIHSVLYNVDGVTNTVISYQGP